MSTVDFLFYFLFKLIIQSTKIFYCFIYNFRCFFKRSFCINSFSSYAALSSSKALKTISRISLRFTYLFNRLLYLGSLSMFLLWSNILRNFTNRYFNVWSSVLRANRNLILRKSSVRCFSTWKLSAQTLALEKKILAISL